MLGTQEFVGNLICSHCGEVLVSNEVVMWNDGFDCVTPRVHHLIAQKIKEHPCLMEKVFRLGQWVLNTNTKVKTLIDDQVLADLLNEQRAQGLNKHLQPL